MQGLLFSLMIFFHSLGEAQLKQLFLPFENEGISIPAEMLTYLDNLFSVILAEFHGDAEISLLSKYTSLTIDEARHYRGLASSI